MSLHFAASEFAERRARLNADMAERRLDGMLLFSQNSMYWLTGYDTFGFCFFQCLYVGANGRTALLTRSADLRQAQHTSDIADIRIWRDGAGAEPARDLAAMLRDLGVVGQRLGVEFGAHGLPYADGLKLVAALDGQVETVDATALIPALRVVKSEAEIAYVRRAAVLSDAADRAAIERLAPGADEGEILAAQHAAIFGGGGEEPGNAFIIGSGADALLCRSKAGRRKLEADDQITLEFAGAYRHYHAAIMRTHVVGKPRPLHRSYHAAAREALLACEAELRPGRTAGDVFAAHARVLDSHGLGAHRLNACGYSLGATFAPSWMDAPMFYDANSFVIPENGVFFLHMILMDSDSQTALCLGRTSLVGASGSTPLNATDLDLVAR
jgi:Xaa-Pro dipeptidase